jgi:hypothetical protein
LNLTQIRSEADFRPSSEFKTGVSLHGHTLHSKESLKFIYKFARRFAPLQAALNRGDQRYRAIHGHPLDLKRGWWTPPLSAHGAWDLERRQIEDKFGVNRSLVSLTDHDSIDAPMTLQVLPECRTAPVSVEWTVPFGGTFFHIGVHNLSGARAREIMADLAAYTDGHGRDLQHLLEMLSADREVLVVFNHPNWDENGIGEENHRETARHFASIYHRYLHAFELNGLRPWTENRSVFDLARAFEKPLISGGDRHGMEPNTMLNLTNAATFAEFVQEIRSGFSTLFFTDQYLEPLGMRILQNLQDIMGDFPAHAHGWKHWSDRTFFETKPGVVRSLHQLWQKEPLAVQIFTRGIDLLRHPQFRQAYRAAFTRREEVVL